HCSEIFQLMSVLGQIRPYDDIPAMSGLTTSGHPHLTAEGLKRAMRRPEQVQQTLARLSDHSITSSASESRVGGTVRPSRRAVLRLITSSNLVDCRTGRSAGLVPLRMRAV